MAVVSANPDYAASSVPPTTHEWVASIFADGAFADGAACLFQEESLTLGVEIGEGVYGKVFRG